MTELEKAILQWFDDYEYLWYDDPDVIFDIDEDRSPEEVLKHLVTMEYVEAEDTDDGLRYRRTLKGYYAIHPAPAREDDEEIPF